MQLKNLLIERYLERKINQETINGLRTVNLVKESISNKRVNEYLNKKNSNVKPKMAVIIQEFIEPKYSGVWIGENIDSGMLEWVEGNGEKLVSGRVIPKNEKWTSELESSSEENIKFENNYIGRELLSLQKKVFDLDNNIADFEWCILDNRIVMLQYRPVTIKLSQNYIPNSFSVENNVFKGIPSSKGVFEGSAKFVNAKNHEGIEWNEGDAIMAWFTDPEMMYILIKSGAIITAMGGFLCHGAIIARELGIPCVVGIGSSAMKTIWKDNKIYVDGNTGEVKRLV
jgi:pyruvate,water dikinase